MAVISVFNTESERDETHEETDVLPAETVIVVAVAVAATVLTFEEVFFVVAAAELNVGDVGAME